jgi:RNA-binding protein 25
MFIKKFNVYEMPPKKDKDKNKDDKESVKEDKEDRRSRDSKDRHRSKDDKDREDRDRRSSSDDKDRERSRSDDKDRDRRSRSDDKERERSRSDDKERSRSDDKERSRSKKDKDDKDRERSRSDDKDRERSRSNDKDRERSRSNDKDRERRSKKDKDDEERSLPEECKGNNLSDDKDDKKNEEVKLLPDEIKELKVDVNENECTDINVKIEQPMHKEANIPDNNNQPNNQANNTTNNQDIEYNTTTTQIVPDIHIDRSPRLSIMKKEEKVKSERKVVINESHNTIKIINNEFDHKQEPEPEFVEKLEKSPRFNPPLDTSPTSARKTIKSPRIQSIDSETIKSPRIQSAIANNSDENIKSPRKQSTIISNNSDENTMKSPRKQSTIITNNNSDENTMKSPRKQSTIISNNSDENTMKSPRKVEEIQPIPSERNRIKQAESQSIPKEQIITKLPLQETNKLTPIDEENHENDTTEEYNYSKDSHDSNEYNMINSKEYKDNMSNSIKSTENSTGIEYDHEYTEKLITYEKEFSKLVDRVKSNNYDFLEFILEQTTHKNIIKIFGSRLLSNNGVILYVIFENEYYMDIKKFYQKYSSTKFSLYEVFTINHNDNRYFNDKIIVTEYYQKSDNDIEKEFRSKNDKLYQISINDSGYNTITCKLFDYNLTDKLTYKIETVCKYESHLIDKNITKLSMNLAFENYYINETNMSNFKSSLNKIISHTNNLFQLYKLFADTFKSHLDKNVIEYYMNISKYHPDVYQLYKNQEKILKQISLNDVNDKLKLYHTNTIQSSIYDIDEKEQLDYTRIIKKSRIQTAYLRYFDELLTNCDDEIKMLVNYTILIIKFCDSKTLIPSVIQNSHEDLMNRIKTTYNNIFSDLNKFKNMLNY